MPIEVEPDMDGSRIELQQQASNGVLPEHLPLEDLRRVVSLRDSNLIEVEDSIKEKTLCAFPQKLGQSGCIKKGDFLIVEESAQERTGEAGRKATRTVARLLSDEHVLVLRKSPFWPSAFQDSSQKVRGGTELPAPVEAQKAPVGSHLEKAQGAAELSVLPVDPQKAPVESTVPVEAPKAPGERNVVNTQGDKPPAVMAAPKAPVEHNGEKSHGATDLPVPEEALVDSVEQHGGKLRGAAEPSAPVEAPKATSEQTSKKAQGPSEHTVTVEAPKATGNQNGPKAGGGIESLAAVEPTKTVVENNAQTSQGGAERVAFADVSSVEQNSVDNEVNDGERTNKDSSLSSLWTNGATEVNWEIAENQSVLGPGPTDDEKAVEYKPTPANELHTYFMIRIPKFSDNKGKTEIRMAELRFKETAEKRDFINAAMQMKRASRTEALHKLKAARDKVRACVDAIRQKKDELSPLQGALKKLRDTGRQARDKSRDLPASEQELDKRIAYCEYRIQHESIPLKEEKQLLREIKSLKDSREVVCANEALHVEYSESLGEREDIQERLKPLMSELESLKAEWTIATKMSKEAEAEFEGMDIALSQVQDQWTAANQARQDAYDERAGLIRQENAQNDEFYQNRREIQHVRQLAFKKEKKAVEELCNAQVERVMRLWNTNNEFRAAYVKSNEKSTLKRLQTLDGRALGPDEEPPLISGDSNDSLSGTQMAAGFSVSPATFQREVPAVVSHDLVPATSDIQRKGNHLESPIVLDPNGHLPPSNATAGTGAFSNGQEEKGEEDLAAAAKLKQKRREQEMAKAKEAEERKKRSAQRLQSKALARAQKEADRLEKEKEKRSQKKAARLTNSSQGIAPASDGGRGAVQEAERGLDAVQEPPPKSAPISRFQKRSSSQIPRTIKTPIVSSLTKKDGIHLPTRFWTLGLVVLVAILALLAIFVR